jgi:hypothetical protein
VVRPRTSAAMRRGALELGHMRRAALELALAFVVCCGSDAEEYEIDGAWTETQRAEIERAAADWNAISVRALRPTPKGEWLIVRAFSPKPGLGLVERSRRLVRISPATPDDQVYAVALHEFGHVLGLKHVGRGVMSATEQITTFSAEDLAECHRAGAC